MLLHCALSLAAQCIVIGPVCGGRTTSGRAGGVRTLLQPARAQCLRLSERFFIVVIIIIYIMACYITKSDGHTNFVKHLTKRTSFNFIIKSYT